MPEVTLDFTKKEPPRRKNRNKIDIARYWHTRYGAFLKDGFTDAEAKWGADNGLSLKNEQVKRVRSHRKALIKYYMGRGKTRMGAIEMAAADLQENLERFDVKELNIFYEVYTIW